MGEDSAEAREEGPIGVFAEYRTKNVVKEVLNYMYVAKENRWLAKHKFMLVHDSAFPQDVLRNIWGFMHGHGP